MGSTHSRPTTSRKTIQFILGVFLVVSAFVPVATTAVSAVGDYFIGPNDVVEISVYGESNLTQEVQVTASGNISYPLLGRIQVVGMSVTQLEDFIHDALAKDYIRNPQVRVFVKTFSSVYVLGQVEEPGPYPFSGGMTLLQAITTASGFTNIANKRKVRIVRTVGNERQTIHVNAASVSKGDRKDVPLRPGDTVVVGESFF
jgi:protein involved in polysaccharide export with SLBB domain